MVSRPYGDGSLYENAIADFLEKCVTNGKGFPFDLIEQDVTEVSDQTTIQNFQEILFDDIHKMT